MKKFDFIIVGGGTAGCIIANRLSAIPDYSVLLLEAGRNADHLFLKLPAGQSQVVANKHWDWRLPALADKSCANRETIWPAGKCLGGSSSINGMVYVRGHRLDFDNWQALGNKGWGYQDVLPYFKRIESFYLLDNPYRGTAGLVNVREVIKPHPLTSIFIESARELNIPFNPDYNGREQEGVSLCQTNQSKRWRQSTAEAYLKPVAKRKNLTIITEATVQKIHFDGMTAQSVSVQLKEGVVLFQANIEIILCAGTMNSPKLLLQSGIGPREELFTQCIHPLKGVGRNLQEHPNSWLSALVNIPTYNNDLHPWRGMKHLWQWLKNGGGALATPIAHALCFIKTKKELEQPDIQIHFTPFSYELKDSKLFLSKDSAFVLTANICRPKTRGFIKLRSPDPNHPLLISYQALADEQDLKTLIVGCQFARKLIHSKAFKPYVLSERFPGETVVSEQEWMDYLRNHSSLGYHPVGSCKMGHDDEAVVDSSLKVHGLQRLRIADASIMPVITSGNTNAPTMMIAEKAADLILLDYK